MTLSKPIKILVGVATFLVCLLPFTFFLLWGLMMIPISRGEPGDFQAISSVFSLIFPLVCCINLLIYALYAFYVTHAIKNEGASDVVRIIGLLSIFIIPFLGMPFYYIVYILLPTPPTWAMKKQPAVVVN